MMNNKAGKPIAIVCEMSYEFEGRQYNKGDISYKSWGRNTPDGWRNATQEDIDDYWKRKKQLSIKK